MLGRKLSGDAVHSHFGIDQDVRRIVQDRLSPAVEWQWALNETAAECGSNRSLRIRFRPRVIAKYLEPGTVNVAEPPSDRNLPVGMLEEVPADDTNPHL